MYWCIYDLEVFFLRYNFGGILRALVGVAISWATVAVVLGVLGGR